MNDFALRLKCTNGMVYTHKIAVCVCECMSEKWYQSSASKQNIYKEKNFLFVASDRPQNKRYSRDAMSKFRFST